MVFAEFARERFFLTLKSGLLCAAMLMPAAALADSQAVNGEKPPQVIRTAILDIDSETGSTEAKPADQRKVVSLSQHIQRKYKVPEYKANQIVQAAVINGKRHQVEPELILAIIAVESTFKERAVSRVGARGLMQVMPGSHRSKIREIGGSHALFDPGKNIHTGSRILVNYLDAHSGNLRRALLSYNGSLGTRSSFPDRVMRIYRDFQRVTVES
jgi:soluble lytic murein transglycosylase-like protein